MPAPQLGKFKKYFNRGKKPSIQEIVREPTAGGVVYRRNKQDEIEILLIQDAKRAFLEGPSDHVRNSL